MVVGVHGGRVAWCGWNWVCTSAHSHGDKMEVQSLVPDHSEPFVFIYNMGNNSSSCV